uniref:Uncharacterized protein n=1 Tax=Alexandrium catenella TaxID=2925 RepID=A0A7S1SF67_ALECA|mmetsp:Transcript_98098/g.260638  ORF Transcript_98098/g.260638 Transcript_98098/m.260638 type:complete len:307 (+) Transcript_98098:83-1003(+)
MFVRSSLAAAAYAVACSGQPTAASGIDDQNSLLQRFAEEPQRPRDYQLPFEVKYAPWHLKPLGKKLLDKVTGVTKNVTKRAWDVQNIAGDKLVKSRKNIRAAIYNRTTEAGEHLAKVSKRKMKDVTPLWRKERNGTDFGILDGIIEKTRSSVNSKVAKIAAKTLVKTQDLQNRVNDEVIQKVPQSVMDMFVPPAGKADGSAAGSFNPLAPLGGAFQPQSDEFALPKGKKLTEMEEAAMVNKFRQAEQAKQKVADQATAQQQGAEAKTQKGKAKREQDRLAYQKRLKEKKDLEDATPNSNAWSEGIE